MNKLNQDNTSATAMENALERAAKRYANESIELDAQGQKLSKPIPVKRQHHASPIKAAVGERDGSYTTVVDAFPIAVIIEALKTKETFNGLMNDMKSHYTNRFNLEIEVLDGITTIISKNGDHQKAYILSYALMELIVRTRKNSVANTAVYPLTPVDIMQNIGMLDRLHRRIKND